MPFACSVIFALILPTQSTLSSFLLVKSSPPIVKGKDECPCIGMKGATGTSFPEGTKTNGTSISYSDETGQTCAQWDLKFDSACWVRHPPDWCLLKWCFVNPCSCNLPTPPMQSEYFPDAKLAGVPVWKSYATCGSGDLMTSTRTCPHLTSQKTCEPLRKPDDVTQLACGWVPESADSGAVGICLAKELVDVCAS